MNKSVWGRASIAGPVFLFTGEFSIITRLFLIYIMSIFGKLFGSSNEGVVNQFKKIVDQINALEPEFEKKSQDELKALTAEWKKDLAELDLDATKEYLEKIL